MYDQVVKCQRAGLCLSEHFLIISVAHCRLDFTRMLTIMLTRDLFAVANLLVIVRYNDVILNDEVNNVRGRSPLLNWRYIPVLERAFFAGQ